MHVPDHPVASNWRLPQDPIAEQTSSLAGKIAKTTTGMPAGGHGSPDRRFLPSKWRIYQFDRSVENLEIEFFPQSTVEKILVTPSLKK